MDAVDGLASNIGYAVITAIVSTAALIAVIRWQPAYNFTRLVFLLTWGAIGVVAPLYSFFVIALPAGNLVSGALATLACLFLIGGPFIYFGWPRLRSSLSMF